MGIRDVTTVAVESPFRTQTILLANGEKYVIEEAQNVLYARACVRDCLNRGESPFAAHLLYTQEGILDDEDLNEHRRSMEAGFEMAAKCDRRVFYVDRGFCEEMRWGLLHAQDAGQLCEIRILGAEWAIGWTSEMSVTSLVDRLRD